MIKILFFTPTGGQSGSEILISRMVSMLDKKEFEAHVFLEKGNIEHIDGFSKIYANPFNNKRGIFKYWYKIKNLITKRVYQSYILSIHKKTKPDFWYINTVLMSHIAEIAVQNNIPFISHYHELPHIHFELVRFNHLKSMVENSILNIGNADCTCQILATMGAKNIKRVYPFLDTKIDKPKQNSTKTKVRTTLSIPQDAFVWIISGAVTYAKGVEFLPLVAQKFNNCHFVWIGGNTDSGSFFYTQKVVSQLENVHLVGSKNDEDYQEYFSCGNGLLLLSLEESFGLVVLEAAQIGIPTVAINAGGVNEIIVEGMGTLINKLETKTLFEAIENTISNLNKFDKQIAKKRLQSFDKNNEMKIWENEIKKLKSLS
jgi:glycosyltransferase involved in cell wall biosynthesis